MATAYLKRLPASDGSNTTATLSAWVKRGDGLNAAAQSCAIGGQEGTDGNNRIFFGFWGDSTLALQIVNGGTAYEQSSAAIFRDPAAWYHIVARLDTTNGVAQDRVQLFVNGEKITAYTTNDTFPSSVDIKLFENTTSCETLIGARKSSSTYNNISGGSMAHVHIIDGTAYDASAFGETDSTSGIWIAKTSPSVTYGTNGGFYKFQDTSNYGDDSAGSNDMTMVGTITQTKDTPDNNFATLNPIYPSNGFTAQSPTFVNGNNTLITVNASGEWGISPSSMALSTGKWYAECKISSSSGDTLVGILSYNWAADQYLGYYSGDYGYYSSNGQIQNDGGSAYGDTYTTADIIGIYLDLDNNKLYFAKNGTIQNSGTGFTITAAADTNKESYMLAAQEWNSSGNGTFQWNFGNGYFGTDLIASASADAGGEGQFKYNPSTGTFDGSSKDFRAICTNNIATYG